MIKTVRKWSKYYGKKADMALEERADPKVQLEQAIAEAQDQHRRLRELGVADERAVGGAEVEQDDSAQDLRVPLADEAVIQDDVALGVPADDDRVAFERDLHGRLIRLEQS